jgi:hypothetical protein
MTAGAHEVEDAQTFEAEGVAGRHGMSLLIPAAYRMEQTMNASTAKR